MQTDTAVTKEAIGQATVAPVTKEKAQMNNQNNDEINTCVSKLNHLHKKDSALILEMGKLVHEFVLKVTKNRTIWVNAFKLLAEHEGCLLQEGQLRLQEGAYLLHQKMKAEGNATNLTVTHFATVLTNKLNFDAKVELLKKAEKHNWSVSQLKKHIVTRNADNNGDNTGKSEIVVEWESQTKKLNSSIRQCLSHMSALNNIKGTKSIPHDIQESVANLIKFANINGFVTNEQPAHAEEWKAA